MPLHPPYKRNYKKKMSLIRVAGERTKNQHFLCIFYASGFPRGGFKKKLFSAPLEALYSSTQLSDSHHTILHPAPGLSASSLTTQKLDKKATVRKRQDAETEIHGNSC